MVEVAHALFDPRHKSRVERFVGVLGVNCGLVKFRVEGEHVGEEVAIASNASHGDAQGRPLHKIAKGDVVDFHLQVHLQYIPRYDNSVFGGRWSVAKAVRTLDFDKAHEFILFIIQ